MMKTTQARAPAGATREAVQRLAVPARDLDGEAPDAAAQLDGAERLGHSLGAISVAAPVQREAGSADEEKEQDIQLQRGQAAIQRTYLADDDDPPPDGPDPEAGEIVWYKSVPWIDVGGGNWKRVSREMVNNQRGEREAAHQVDPAHLAAGVKKVFNKGKTKVFRVTGGVPSPFLKVVYNYGVAVTAYYLSDGEARREFLDHKASDLQWDQIKKQLGAV